LLGLPPGEQDADRIEPPGAAAPRAGTPLPVDQPRAGHRGENRLAQAFVCLTDPQARSAYNQALFGSMQPEPISPVAETAAAQQPVAGHGGRSEFLSLIEEKVQDSRCAPQPMPQRPAKRKPPEAPVAEPLAAAWNTPGHL